ncbi:MAG: hypothetical protein AAF633_22675, partial [Chloroflexota bacterium]
AGQANVTKPSGAGPCDAASQPVDPPSSGWQSVNTFESYSGSMDGQGGWSSNGAVAVADPELSANQVMQITRSSFYAHKDLPDGGIPQGSTGTLFFRLYRSGTVNTYAGGSDAVDPLDFSEFEVQIGGFANESVSEISVRDGSGFLDTGDFEDKVWYCFWLEANNSSDTFRAYVKGGDFTQRTLLSSNGTSIFDFRNGTDSNGISEFLILTGSGHIGVAYIDDIYLDVGQANSSEPGGDCSDRSEATATPTPDMGTPTPEPPSTPTPQTGWQAVTTFEGLSGEIQGQDGWTANQATVKVDPVNPENEVLSVAADDSYAYRQLPANGVGSFGVQNGETSTLFFRFYRSGMVNSYVGATDTNQAPEFSDYQVQVGAYVDSLVSEISVRDGGTFRSGESFRNEAWHCVWVVVDNSFENYRVYVKGGDFPSRTRMSLNAVVNFDFRNGFTGDDIDTLLIRNGDGMFGEVLIDDIFLDAGQENAGQPGGECEQLPPEQGTPTGTPNPNPTDPPTATPTSPPSGPVIYSIFMPYSIEEPEIVVTTPPPPPPATPCAYAEIEPNNESSQARNNPVIPDCDVVVVTGRMTSGSDRFDIIRIDTNAAASYQFELNDIPDGLNYDMFLANDDRDIIAKSERPGSTFESISFNLAANKIYYIAIFNVDEAASEQPYRLEIRKE